MNLITFNVTLKTISYRKSLIKPAKEELDHFKKSMVSFDGSTILINHKMEERNRRVQSLFSMLFIIIEI